MIDNKILRDAVEHAMKGIDDIDVQSLIELKMQPSDNGYNIKISTNILGFPYNICEVKIFSLGETQAYMAIKPKDLEPINGLVEDDITLGVMLRYLKRSVVSVLYSFECGIISNAFSPTVTRKSDMYKKLEKEIETENRDKKIDQYL